MAPHATKNVRTLRGTGPILRPAGLPRRPPSRGLVDLSYHVLGLHVKELGKDPALGLALLPGDERLSHLVYSPHVEGYSVGVALRSWRGPTASVVDVSTWVGLPSGYRARAGEGLIPGSFTMARVDHLRMTILLWARGLRGT